MTNGPGGREWTVVHGNGGLFDNGDALESVSPSGSTRYYSLHGATVCGLAAGDGEVWTIAGASEVPQPEIALARTTPSGATRNIIVGLPSDSSPGEPSWHACQLVVAPTGVVTFTVDNESDGKAWIGTYNNGAVTYREIPNDVMAGVASTDDVAAVAYYLTSGEDGNVWVLSGWSDKTTGQRFEGFLRVSPAGSITEFPDDAAVGQPAASRTGIWYPTTTGLGLLTYSGHQTAYSVRGIDGLRPTRLQVAVASDGIAWWVSQNGLDGSVTRAGSQRTLVLAPDDTGSAATDGGSLLQAAIAPGPPGDQSVWVAGADLSDLIRISTGRSLGTLTATVGSRHHLLVRSGRGSPWRNLAGNVRSAPVLLPYDDNVLIFAEGPHRALWSRSLTTGWRRLTKEPCVDPSIRRSGLVIDAICSASAPAGASISVGSAILRSPTASRVLRTQSEPSVVGALRPGSAPIEFGTDATFVARPKVGAHRDLYVLHAGESPRGYGRHTLPMPCASRPIAQYSYPLDVLACTTAAHRLAVETLNRYGTWSRVHIARGYAGGQIGLTPHVNGTVTAYGLTRNGHIESLPITAGVPGSWHPTAATGMIGVASIDR